MLALKTKCGCAQYGCYPCVCLIVDTEFQIKPFLSFFKLLLVQVYDLKELVSSGSVYLSSGLNTLVFV